MSDLEDLGDGTSRRLVSDPTDAVLVYDYLVDGRRVATTTEPNPDVAPDEPDPVTEVRDGLAALRQAIIAKTDVTDDDIDSAAKAEVVDVKR